MFRRYFGLLAPTAGLEPATLCLTGTCSYHLSYIGTLCGKTAQRLLLSSRDIGKGLFIPAEKQTVWCGHSSALATSPGKQNNATTLLKATESFELPTWREVCFIQLNYAAIYHLILCRGVVLKLGCACKVPYLGAEIFARGCVSDSIPNYLTIPVISTRYLHYPPVPLYPQKNSWGYMYV